MCACLRFDHAILSTSKIEAGRELERLVDSQMFSLLTQLFIQDQHGVESNVLGNDGKVSCFN